MKITVNENRKGKFKNKADILNTEFLTTTLLYAKDTAETALRYNQLMDKAESLVDEIEDIISEGIFDPDRVDNLAMRYEAFVQIITSLYARYPTEDIDALFRRVTSVSDMFRTAIRG